MDSSYNQLNPSSSYSNMLFPIVDFDVLFCQHQNKSLLISTTLSAWGVEIVSSNRFCTFSTIYPLNGRENRISVLENPESVLVWEKFSFFVKIFNSIAY